MDAVKLATEGPPTGKEHRTPELYFEDVLKGSRIVEGSVQKTLSLNEYIHVIMSCTMKQDCYVI